MYLRLHGATELYQSRYTQGELEHWARLIEAWRQGKEPQGARLIGPSHTRAHRGRDVYC